MDGPFYQTSMYVKDYQSSSGEGEIIGQGYHGFMSVQAPACYYACSSSAQGNGQETGQGYFGAQAMAVVDHEEQEKQSFASSSLEHQLLHPAFSHLQHLQQHYHQNQQHSHHQHPFLSYGVDEVAAHLAQSQAERLHQACDIQQQQHLHHNNHQNIQQHQPSDSFNINGNQNNQPRHQHVYHSGQGHHSSRGQAASIQQALLVDSVLSNLPQEGSPNEDDLLSTAGASNSVHNLGTAEKLSPLNDQDSYHAVSPPTDLDLGSSCKQQQQQSQQPLPFPWMKTTKSHAHQWKAQWPGKIHLLFITLFQALQPSSSLSSSTSSSSS
ncbi:transcription factor Lox1 [Elysia marginata]|uniref:Transcription factor Lox1 n=1 Tax=Elysia marginata TaxID=1093978 RepID=A0AAV4HP14_9GAST|nr:transcription factor Lox1 [Elysia marginata]